MTSSNGNIFRVTGPLCGEFTGPGEFPTQRPVTGSFDVFFDLRLNKRLSKQPWGWWFETPSWSLWRQCNEQFQHQLGWVGYIAIRADGIIARQQNVLHPLWHAIRYRIGNEWFLTLSVHIKIHVVPLWVSRWLCLHVRAVVMAPCTLTNIKQTMESKTTTSILPAWHPWPMPTILFLAYRLPIRQNKDPPSKKITSLTVVYSTVYPDADERNIKALRHWPLCGEFTGDRWIPRKKGQ